MRLSIEWGVRNGDREDVDIVGTDDKGHLAEQTARSIAGFDPRAAVVRRCVTRWVDVEDDEWIDD